MRRMIGTGLGLLLSASIVAFVGSVLLGGCFSAIDLTGRRCPCDQGWTCVAEHLPESRAAGFVADLCELAPIVGQQVTLTSTNSAVAGPRISLMIARAATPFDCSWLFSCVTSSAAVMPLSPPTMVTPGWKCAARNCRPSKCLPTSCAR